MSKSNVIALPTAASGDQSWQCQVCKKSFSYSQPIGFGLQLALLKAFMDAHEHDAKPVMEPIVASPLADILAYAQQCELDGIYLDAGRTEHLQLAAHVKTLVQLVQDIRREVTGGVPQCINKDGLERLISKALAK